METRWLTWIRSVMFDFAGPYTIGRGDLAFGKPTRFLQCHVPRERLDEWDAAVAKGCAIYETRMHNLWCVVGWWS